jgi:hypothetical protein
MGQSLRDRSDDFDIDGFGQTGELFQRVLNIPRVAILVDSNEECVFFRFTGVS